jgi:hypothetical protein
MSDVDMSGPVWLFKPPTHKTAYRGNDRVVAIGPRTQALMRQFSTLDPAEYQFCPRRAVEELLAGRSAKRITPKYPSRVKRNAAKRVKRPLRSPAERYTTMSYGHAVARACDLAFPPPAPLGQPADEMQAEWWDRLTEEQRIEVKAWRKAHRWHPNQLRHLRATEVRQQHGLEAAQVLLGHSRADVTQVYAERDTSLAVRVAAETG